jgi:tetratricopeptide (TPR) repeat protein
VSEETEGQDASAEALAGVAAGADPVAIALAVNAADTDSSIAQDTRVFLRKQAALIDDQRHYVRERYKQLVEQVEETWLRVWALRLTVFLRLATAVVGIAVAASITLMVWYSAHANGLLIEPFSVPSDLANRGLTGQVVAAHLLDKLTAMQNATTSVRPAQSYANNWGDDIRVEIPETGVSVGELQRVLRNWLGHDTHISGDIYRTGSEIAVTARAGGENGATFVGSEADLDTLVQKAAENVYKGTQPYRYANFVRTYGRVAEAQEIYNRLAEDPSPLEKAWALSGLATTAWSIKENLREARAYDHRAIEVYPDFIPAYINLIDVETYLGHDEAALAAGRTAERLLKSSTNPVMDAKSINPSRIYAGTLVGILLGDYAGADQLARSGAETPTRWDTRETYGEQVAEALALMHDGKGMRAYLLELGPSTPDNIGFRSLLQLQMNVGTQNWQVLAASEEAAEKIFAKSNSGLDIAVFVGTQFRPWLALAKARLGDFVGAQALIARTEADCYDCIRVRGSIAAIGRNWSRADYWFARAVHDAPSIPMAYSDWGESLLARGKPDDAITKFTIANQKGPHFADPLELWGEALMAKNQSHLALAKFADADKYAPNWGRLHLKWGEALMYAGRKDDAKTQFARAAQLDLTAADEAELVRQPLHGG